MTEAARSRQNLYNTVFFGLDSRRVCGYHPRVTLLRVEAISVSPPGVDGTDAWTPSPIIFSTVFLPPVLQKVFVIRFRAVVCFSESIFGPLPVKTFGRAEKSCLRRCLFFFDGTAYNLRHGRWKDMRAECRSAGGAGWPKGKKQDKPLRYSDGYLHEAARRPDLCDLRGSGAGIGGHSSAAIRLLE